MDFTAAKDSLLNKIDLSRKGSIDCRIVELVNFINAQESYVTTSSCSGRTSVLVQSALKKKGCEWLFVSHDIIYLESVLEALEEHTGSAVLKFEPFVLHVLCSTLEAAQELHTAAIESGFRNSGLSISKKGKIISAIRSTLSLEVPLSFDGNVLVSDTYIANIVHICNEKMNENWKRIDRLFSQLKTIVAQSRKSSEKEPISKPHHVNSERHLREIKDEKRDDNSPDLFFDSFDELLNLAVS